MNLLIDDFDKPQEKNKYHIPIFRHNFTENIMNELTAFAKLHEYDKLCDFKEAWKIWTTQNNNIVIEETERLKSVGFNGNVLDKMYKGVRYYFRKKSLVPALQPVRDTYIALPKALLQLINDQIHRQLRVTDSSMPPAKGFELFCHEYKVIIADEIQTFYTINVNVTPTITRENVNAFLEKLKKTYKNRFYIIRIQSKS
jgi:hypothetical protein